MLGILKFLHVFLLASVKYFLTFPYAMLIGLDFGQTMLVVTLGGIAGFVFFYFLSGLLIKSFLAIKATVKRLLPEFLVSRIIRLFKLKAEKQKAKLVFSKKNRFIVNFRTKYGFWGIIITTPILLSIPIGAFLLNKYYSRQRFAFAYMIVSIVGWAMLFSAIVIIFPKPI
ncbi:hypothetical protein ACUNWD_19940 [Sunxiuqinia sp. A32]|uniref:hypothetical protein n=1 Tax=Sunxiuqinia sp. A32 TaxID=3461496 RepID=UPI004045D89C